MTPPSLGKLYDSRKHVHDATQTRQPDGTFGRRHPGANGLASRTAPSVGRTVPSANGSASLKLIVQVEQMRL